MVTFEDHDLQSEISPDKMAESRRPRFVQCRRDVDFVSRRRSTSIAVKMSRVDCDVVRCDVCCQNGLSPLHMAAQGDHADCAVLGAEM